MIIHCEINCKSELKLLSGQNRYKVEFIYRGYWAKWYAAYSANEAMLQFKEQNPEKTYCRTKTT